MQSPDGGVVGNLPPQERIAFSGTIRSLVEGDLVHIRPILETWLRDPETGVLIEREVARDLAQMRSSIEGGIKHTYFVAEEDRKTIGVIGMNPTPQEALAPFVATANPYELIRLYVDKDQREGRGVGTALVERWRREAVLRGATELLVESGPRYKESAWPFYDKMFGPKIAMIENYYGPGIPTAVWREQLVA